MKGGYIVHTGAWESALNINIAPKISIRKPINQDLLKAYALITWMPITTINYKIWFNWACMKIKRVVIYIKKKEPWTWKRVGEEWRCPFSEELCRCCFRLLLLTLKESIPTSPISLFLSRSLAQMYPPIFVSKQYESYYYYSLFGKVSFGFGWGLKLPNFYICFVGGGGHSWWCGLVLHEQSMESEHGGGHW